ncbi:hypothetical protein GCM10011496_08120 [Polaromonas eurypsychrophila]|uniref:RNA polymerase sigma-70 region 2 domain-containing protein n=1 Tax=Polaromonas eurypsychrophila TaxID=1614635 RepID=A0A916S9H9_9BURK|nr:hypothetical protein GCM10011496_08120 [Polaromonas eurypsychrophila]
MSETLLAALAKPQAFGNRSQLKTWLIGVLKHKVIDQIRSNAREVATPGHGTEDEGDELDRLVFNSDGHFASPAGRLGRPAAKPVFQGTGRQCGTFASGARTLVPDAGVAGAFLRRSL